MGDFPITRQTMERLDEWVMALASPLLPAVDVPAGPEHLKGAFRWEFQEQTERVVLVGKAIRGASGIRAALLLADHGYIAECGTVLRTVSDFTYEMLSICRGIETGSPTSAQKKFLRQYFTPMSENPEQFAKEKRERWVTRDELLSAHVQSFAASGNADPEKLRMVLRYLSYGYDKFVHGAYITAMELYDGASGTFMLNGHRYPEKIAEYKWAVASKLHEFLSALATVANVQYMRPLAWVIAVADRDLATSGELAIE
jgi:hypothetical protein